MYIVMLETGRMEKLVRCVEVVLLARWRAIGSRNRARLSRQKSYNREKKKNFVCFRGGSLMSKERDSFDKGSEKKSLGASFIECPISRGIFIHTDRQTVSRRGLPCPAGSHLHFSRMKYIIYSLKIKNKGRFLKFRQN